MSNNVVQPARMSLVLPSRTHVFLFYFIFRVLCPYQSLWVNSFFFFVRSEARLDLLIFRSIVFAEALLLMFLQVVFNPSKRVDVERATHKSHFSHSLRITHVASPSQREMMLFIGT